MQVTYGVWWNFDRHTPIDALTPEQAQHRDTSGELYSAALGDPARPDVVIEVEWKNQFLGVWFFDEQRRQALNYSFAKIDDVWMFLTNVTRWQYPDDTVRGLDECSLMEELRYERDGIVRHIVLDIAAAEKHTTDRHSVKLDINWEPVPTFGDWASVARYDREPLPGTPAQN